VCAEDAERTARDAIAHAQAAAAAQAAAETAASEGAQRAKHALARAEHAEQEREEAIARAGEAARERDLARHSELERETAEQDAQRARKRGTAHIRRKSPSGPLTGAICQRGVERSSNPARRCRSSPASGGWGTKEEVTRDGAWTGGQKACDEGTGGVGIAQLCVAR
jgi:hypothetical protein